MRLKRNCSERNRFGFERGRDLDAERAEQLASHRRHQSLRQECADSRLERGEVTGVENDQVLMQDIFEYERTGISNRGKVLGQFHGCNAQPLCLERLKAYGVHLSPAIFSEVHEVKEK